MHTAPVHVKICGITTPAAATMAVEAGVNAIGVVFAPGRRQVTPAQAADILAAVPPLVTSVGVFVNAPPDQVAALVRALGLHAAQLHGEEPPEACADLQRRGIPVIKAIRVSAFVDHAVVSRYAKVSSAVLLDTKIEGVWGGTGHAFSWEAAVGLSARVRLIVAGGLTPANVVRVLELLQPYGVDVTSGVETGGQKDPAKVREFISRVRQWEAGPSGAS